MQVHRNIDEIPSIRNAVVTIGTFDGVHTGHKKILAQLKDEARQVAGESVLITFHPHPRKVLADEKRPIQLINTLDEKIELLKRQGLHHLVIVPFTKQFSNLSADEYVNDFLIGKFHPHTVIIGYDHRFGHDRKGDYRLLEDYAGRLQFFLKEIPEHVINSITVSSTRIRDAIRTGDIHTANQLLGYHFFFAGEVIDGNKLGRTLGYPTANLGVNEEEKLVPGNGIYAVEAEIEGWQSKAQTGRLKGMMSIGIRPTIGDNKRMIEVNLFDFDEEIYGKTMRVYVKAYMRPEVKFEGLEALKGQLAKDEINARALLNP
ncbi:MAG TPA: bifunctional riboflavin kinase/FAD synthetase [Chitinophagaceae bacterium]|nr:bifunctional riboflavin kinase/FAD synthetase [Chitinophagaceae bacterium]